MVRSSPGACGFGNLCDGLSQGNNMPEQPLHWWEPGRGLLCSQIAPWTLIKPSSLAPMDVKEHRKKTKLNCFKQTKHCRAAQRNQLPGGSTARCHPHPMPQKENCHWEKKLCFLGFFSSYFSLSLFLTKTKTLANAPPTLSAHLSSFSSSCRAQGCSGQNHRGFPPLSKLSAAKRGEI